MKIENKYIATPEEPIMSVEGTKIVRSKNRTPRCVLADGTTLSIQYHCAAYITDRPDPTDTHLPIKLGKITEVEIGFPSCTILEILGYAECPETPTDTVYGYVPAWLIDGVIKSRGGIVGFECWHKIHETEIEK